ncbi:MAG: shikimate kinase [Verrucomicrobia bacterium]|nr:MAG: shikimate kinase [Verrucomicrobiota bacterium]PYJ93325.1 MAG: shikimate kinase [Verrucomicrobiota bacterium]PYL19544.1 MAG: shikimate kinase [Verrucomicrobiota bacterium]PYL82537.1 MAG: shikimate kinase [Verrucomicrobiota bacterium]
MLELEVWSVSIMNRTGKSIVLIGMMGAGKSSVGRCLHRRTRLALLDTDDIVASKFGISIPEIFFKYGEQRFREAETQALRGLAPATQAIIVTGGGIVLREENVDRLKRLGILIWIDANEKTLFERASRAANRPLLEGDNPREAFAQMLQARLPLYAKIAHLRVDTSVLTDEEVAVAILSKLRRLDRNPGLGLSIPATAQ